MVVLLTGRPCPALGADAALRRIVMLPLVDRTTVVAELAQPVARVQEITSTPSTVMIEAGPVDAATKPLDLTPIGRSLFVDHLSVRILIGPDALTYLRIQITLAVFCAHRLRVSGSRVYVDLMPAQDAAPPGRPRVALAPQLPREPVSKGARLAVAMSEASIDAAYRAFESSTLERARDLVRRHDVKQLLQLRDEIIRRDDALGQRRPEIVQRLLSEVLRYTNDARAAQLEQDRRAFGNAR